MLTAEYNRATSESNLFRVVNVDKKFPEYIEKVKAPFIKLIEELTSSKSISKQVALEIKRYQELIDSFSANADAAWSAYVNRDLTHAIEPRFKFDGQTTKKTYYLPAKNCKKYINELKEAIDFTQRCNTKDEGELACLKQYVAYHHRGFIYLSTTEAKTRIEKKIALGVWKELKRLSENFEQMGNVILSQN